MVIRRTDFRSDGIFGLLFDDDGDQIAVTLEHSYDGRPKIPAGTYHCHRGQHRLHGMEHDFETFEVMDVPGHLGLLFHWGNYNTDSDGCILLGRVMTASPIGWMITNSRETFTRFILDRDGIEVFDLTIEDAIRT